MDRSHSMQEFVDITELQKSFEHPLTSQQHSLALAFARGLFNGHVDDIKAQSPKNLGEIYALQISIHSHFFYLGYFLTEEGQGDAQTLGLSADMSIPSMQQQLYDLPQLVKMEIQERKAIAQRSNRWRRQKLADMLLQDPSHDEAFEPFSYAEVNTQPSILLERLEALMAYHHFYRTVESGLGEDDLKPVKQALLTVHQARVDGLLEDATGAATALDAQLIQSRQTSTVEQWAKRLQVLLPQLMAIQTEVDDTKDQQDLEQFLEQQRRLVKVNQKPGKLSAEEIADLDVLRWNAEQLQTFLESVLQTWGLLSAHKATWEEVENREGFAEDGLVQVVTRSTKSNLAVSSTKRVLFVPHDFDRTLTSLYPAGALPVAAHELTHVLQALADTKLAQQIPLAGIKGHRYRTGREAGGLYQEQLVQEVYFGHIRPVNLHYAAALLAKLRGHSQLAVIRAFYDSYRTEHQADEATRLFAVDRGLRLYRRAGYNTKPQDYIEQAAILSQLEAMPAKAAARFALAGGSFSPQHALLLRKAGLLEIPDNLALEPAQTVMAVFDQGGFNPLAKQYNSEKGRI